MIETNLIAKILYIFQRHKDKVYKDKDDLPKTKTTYQRQRRAKDVPKMEVLREDVKDADSKDKDAKDELDVFLMCSTCRTRLLLIVNSQLIRVTIKVLTSVS